MDHDLFIERCEEEGRSPDTISHFIVEVEPRAMEAEKKKTIADGLREKLARYADALEAQGNEAVSHLRAFVSALDDDQLLQFRRVASGLGV